MVSMQILCMKEMPRCVLLWQECVGMQQQITGHNQLPQNVSQFTGNQTVDCRKITLLLFNLSENTTGHNYVGR